MQVASQADNAWTRCWTLALSHYHSVAPAAESLDSPSDQNSHLGPALHNTEPGTEQPVQAQPPLHGTTETGSLGQPGDTAGSAGSRGSGSPAAAPQTHQLCLAPAPQQCCPNTEPQQEGLLEQTEVH